jgi:Anti-sigma-28 factor, FlgM
MYWHSPVGLRGPVARARTWWNVPAGESNTAVAVEEIRVDLVARIRQEIAEGRYDTVEKWDAAVEHMFARLERE